MAIITTSLIWSLAILLGLGLFGTFGYMVLQGQPRADSLYVKALTLTAIGCLRAHLNRATARSTRRAAKGPPAQMAKSRRQPYRRIHFTPVLETCTT